MFPALILPATSDGGTPSTELNKDAESPSLFANGASRQHMSSYMGSSTTWNFPSSSSISSADPFAASGSGTKQYATKRQPYKKKMKVRWENERLVGELDHEIELLRQKIFKLGEEAKSLRRYRSALMVEYEKVRRYSNLLFVVILPLK